MHFFHLQVQRRVWVQFWLCPLLTRAWHGLLSQSYGEEHTLVINHQLEQTSTVIDPPPVHSSAQERVGKCQNLLHWNWLKASKKYPNVLVLTTSSYKYVREIHDISQLRQSTGNEKEVKEVLCWDPRRRWDLRDRGKFHLHPSCSSSINMRACFSAMLPPQGLLWRGNLETSTCN